MMKTEIPKFRDESLDIKDAMGHWEFLKNLSYIYIF